jgi:hypothetical protein
MSIFDIFSFKKEATKVFTAENFKAVLETARVEIIKQAKENIPGPEKKILVDNIVIVKIREFRNSCKNKLVLWVIDQIIKVIPSVTQLVYNFLKEKVENL